MKTKDLMTKNPESCLPNDTVYAAARIMRRLNCGVIPVVQDRKSKTLTGILTDRDIALYLGRVNKPAKKVRVGAFAKNKVRVVHPDDSLRQVARLLQRSHLHRLPVVDRQNRLKGIISLKDLALEAFKEKRSRTHWIKEKDLANIVESIARSR